MRGAWEAYSEYLSELCTKRIRRKQMEYSCPVQVGCNGSARYRTGVLQNKDSTIVVGECWKFCRTY